MIYLSVIGVVTCRIQGMYDRLIFARRMFTEEVLRALASLVLLANPT